MQPVLNVEDIRVVEKNLASEGVSISELMHRAGNACVQEIVADGVPKRVVVFTGFGNNGGDGWVAALLLKQQGADVVVVTPAPLEDISSDLARIAAVGARNGHVTIEIAPARSRIEELLEGCDCIIDALFGIGFHGEVRTPFDIWIECINASSARVVSIDVPSGLSAQTGHFQDVCVQADLTVTMIALKPGLLADAGRDVCGTIVVAPLATQTEELVVMADPVAWRCEASDYADVLPTLSFTNDKYTRGSVLVVAGSSRYPGAALLCAHAASRSGAGYVTLAAPASIAQLLQMQLPHVVVVAMPCDEKGYLSEEAVSPIATLAQKATAVVVGPGMGVNAAGSSIVSALLEANTALVIDADGLNNIARLTMNRLDNFPELIRRSAPLVLTPHARELGRLMGLVETAPDSLTSQMDAARRIVWSNGGSECVIVAKSNVEAVVGVDMCLLPKPGPASLATAGTGDVLSGIIAGCLAHTDCDISQLGLLCAFACEVHGASALLAQKRYGTQGVVSTDLVREIGVAIDAMIARCTQALESSHE